MRGKRLFQLAGNGGFWYNRYMVEAGTGRVLQGGKNVAEKPGIFGSWWKWGKRWKDLRRWKQVAVDDAPLWRGAVKTSEKRHRGTPASMSL